MMIRKIGYIYFLLDLSFECSFGSGVARDHYLHPYEAFERLGDVSRCQILTDFDRFWLPYVGHNFGFSSRHANIGLAHI